MDQAGYEAPVGLSRLLHFPLALLPVACKSNEHRLLVTWALLQAQDTLGTGRLRRRDAVAMLRALGVRKSTANTWIRVLCQSRYAKLGQRRRDKEAVIVLRSVSKIHASYGVRLADRDVEIPVHDVICSRSLKRLLGLAAAEIFSGPAARATRTAELGISPSTQRRGERVYRARVIPSYIEHEGASHGDPDSLLAIDRQRVFKHGDKILERGANTVHGPFKVVRRSRRRHSAPQAMAEPTEPRPYRQRFDSDRDLKHHAKRHGLTPRQGYRRVDPGDRRLLVKCHEGTTQRFGRPAVVFRVASEPPARIRVATK
jgi:hypothetical protein